MQVRKTVKPNQLSDEIASNQSLGLLKELHLLTREGQLNADARRKLKQVNHLYNLIFPALVDVAEQIPNFTLVDLGAGKSYLGFIIYDLFFKDKDQGQIFSVESRSELVSQSKAMSQRLGYTRMSFVDEAIEKALLPKPVHIVTALHACDTATDDAIIAGLDSGAEYIAIVPCCQAEVSRLLSDQKKSSLSELWGHRIHRREFGSHLTNVLRALVLEAYGYQVTVTELVGWEHSMKNELILAKKIQNQNGMAKTKLEGLLKEIEMSPKIIRYYKNEYAPRSSP